MSNNIPKMRLRNLDVMRGLAAFVVVLFHYTVIFPDFYPSGKTLALQFDYGLYGVHLFFVISGFVILMSLDSRKGQGFLKSRFIRLYPIYWASVVLSFLIVSAFAPFEYKVSLSSAIVNLTMLQAFAKIQNVDGVYWSLAYELGFYCFLYTIFKMRFDRYLNYIPFGMVVGAIGYHVLKPLIPHPLHLVLMVHSYAHLFACGLALYLIRKNGWSALQVFVLLAAPLVQWSYDGWKAAIVCTFIVLSMAWACLTSQGLGVAAKPFVWLGSVSYALYLTHQMIGFVFMARMQELGFSAATSFSVTLSAALILAHLLTNLIERPAANWMKKRI